MLFTKLKINNIMYSKIVMLVVFDNFENNNPTTEINYFYCFCWMVFGVTFSDQIERE